MMSLIYSLFPSVLTSRAFPLIMGLSTLFWAWMIVDCIRNEPDRSTWIMVLLFLNVTGALIYFCFRRLPQMNIPMPAFLKNLTHGREIDRRQSAVRHIGGAHQYVELGDILLEVGQTEKAKAAYEAALQKSPNDLQAIWGTAACDLAENRLGPAKPALERLLALDPKYKYGEASLAYALLLFNTGDRAAAKARLLEHIKKWKHPQALVTLSKLEIEDGEKDEARHHLESVVHDVKGTPGYYRRKNMRWVRQANRLLRQI